MAALPTTLTLEQFHELDLSGKPHLEFWYGEAIRKPMATFVHGLIQHVLVQILLRHKLIAIPEVRVRLSHDTELVPDMMVTKKLPSGKYPTEAFELAVEIRSPEQSLPWLTEKARYYIAQGVKHVWIIDPEAQTAWMFDQDKPHGEWVSIEDSLTVSNIRLPLQTVFDELDQTRRTIEES